MIRADSYGMMESVELRLPFLDKRVVNFALNLSVKNKIKFGPSWQRKSLLLEKKSIGVAKKYGINNSIVNRVQIGTPYPGRDLEKINRKMAIKKFSQFF